MSLVPETILYMFCSHIYLFSSLLRLSYLFLLFIIRPLTGEDDRRDARCGREAAEETREA